MRKIPESPLLTADREVDKEVPVVIPFSALLAALLILVRTTQHKPEYYDLTRQFMIVVASICGIRPSDLSRGLEQIAFSQPWVIDVEMPAEAHKANNKKRARAARREETAQMSLW